MEEPGFGIGGGGFWHTRAFKHGPSNSDVSHRCYIPLRAELRREPHVSATTIRLPEILLARVAKAAEKSGTTPHSFILEAIAEKTELAEQRTALHTLADKRYAQFLESGEHPMEGGAHLAQATSSRQTLETSTGQETGPLSGESQAGSCSVRRLGPDRRAPASTRCRKRRSTGQADHRRI